MRLRVSVDAGGCSGFQYTFEIDDEELDEEEDVVYVRDGIEVVTDTTSLEYLEVRRTTPLSTLRTVCCVAVPLALLLPAWADSRLISEGIHLPLTLPSPSPQGSTVDYKVEMVSSSFRILENPKSEAACGCGSSFALKNFELNPVKD